MTPIAPLIETFLNDTLARQRGVSRHTRDSYALSFQLLFMFAAKRRKVPPSALTLEHLDAGLVSAFLEDLEDQRKNAPVTRNVRLAAIKSFFRFLEYRQPAALEHIRRVLAIPFKKTDQRLVPYLLRAELQALLDAPDPATRDGIRDRAMLHLAVCAGLRVSELTGLKLEDVDLSSMSIRVLGKGRRERTLPLWKTTAAALRAWLAVRGRVAAPEVFVNARGEPLSRWGFAYLLKQYAATAARLHPAATERRLALTDLCDVDRAALSHRVEDLRSAEVDGRRRDARRLADPRDQVPERRGNRTKPFAASLRLTISIVHWPLPLTALRSLSPA